MKKFESKTVEFINGKLEDFAGVMDQINSLHELYTPQVFGPIERVGSLNWLISFNFNMIFNGFRTREKRIIDYWLPFEKIWVNEKTTLEDLYEKATRKQPVLAYYLDIGDVNGINLPQKGFRVVFRSVRNASKIWPWVEILLAEMERLGFKQQLSPNLSRDQKRGMSVRRSNRANLFKRIKDKNLNLTQMKVAEEAQKKEFERMFDELRDQHNNWDKEKISNEANLKFTEIWGKSDFTSDDVRNDYRDMGWRWKPANRID